MRLRTRVLAICLGMAALATVGSAQKVKIGYDKATDFSKYKTFTLAPPVATPARPLLYAAVTGAISHELELKGLRSVEKDGDLLLVPAGGLDFGMNNAAGTPILPTFSGTPVAFDATMWTGAYGSSRGLSPHFSEGTLDLAIVDRQANKVVWTGVVTEKFDPANKGKSVDLVNKGIAKLLKGFPPKKK